VTPPSARHLPVGVTVVDVDGSRFLLEWLEWDVLAAAAAARVREPAPQPQRLRLVPPVAD
jgi:hypothetical protein